MALPVMHRRFTVDDYYAMASAGVLTEGDRVELIEGEILEMSPIGSPHSGTVGRLTRLCSSRFGSSALVWVQNPVRLSEYSEPQPDLVLLRPRADDYKSGHPTAGDVLLIIEVADSSLLYDRQVKTALYARHQIPEMWLVNLVQRRVVVYTNATPSGYSTVRVAQLDSVISPTAFPQFEFSVEEILR